MTDFFASLGPFGWIVIGLALFGLLNLRRAVAEMWRRPWAEKQEPRPGGDTRRD